MKKKGYIILGIVFLLILIAIISSIIWYNMGLKSPKKVSSENTQTIIEIKSGTSTTNILSMLKQNNVIRSELVAKIYMTLHEVRNLQAGKYDFTGNETLPDVLEIITSGKVMDETVIITFLEGKNMRYIASTIAEKTNNTTNDVYKLLSDDNYILSVIDKYWFLTKDIQNTNIYYPLEGYLYPDTYSFENKEVSVKTIFEKMLDQMDKVLTKNKNRIEESNYSVHDILTMASIVELEGNNSENRPKIASVINMGERDLYAKEINTYNSYNTRGPNMEGKLPVGPIANISEESINAVLNPVNESYLYFVADKNGEIYFSDTYEEHQQTISTLRKKGLWYEYEK